MGRGGNDPQGHRGSCDPLNASWRLRRQLDAVVLIDDDNPYGVVNWLRDRGIEGAVVFRVPVDPTVDVGFHGM